MRSRSRGLTLIELLVGLAIGSLVVLGTVFVYTQSRTTFALNETQARLQENGRYALSIMEPDLQLAGYFGFSNEPSDFFWYNAGSRKSINDLESNDAALTGAPGAVSTCGNNFVVDLLQTIAGSNDAAGPITGSCAPPSTAPLNAGAYVAGTDTVTIRRSSTESTAASAAKIQLYLNAIKRTNQSIFNGTAPGATDTNRQIRDLIVRTYYVAQNSSLQANLPTLWRKQLGSNSGAPAMVDEEILPGVEDLQIQFGIDTADHDGTAGIDPAFDKAAPTGMPDYFNGVVSRWVHPNDALLNPTIDGRMAQVVAVRVWLRIRSDQPETAYADTRTYEYAGKAPFTIPTAQQRFRRVLMSRTIYLRNVRFQ